MAKTVTLEFTKNIAGYTRILSDEDLENLEIDSPGLTWDDSNDHRLELKPSVAEALMKALPTEFRVVDPNEDQSEATTSAEDKHPQSDSEG